MRPRRPRRGQQVVTQSGAMQLGGGGALQANPVPRYGIVRQTVGTNTGGTDDLTIADFGSPEAALLFLPHAVTNGVVRDHAGFGIGMTDFVTERNVRIWSKHGVTTTVTRQSYDDSKFTGTVFENVQESEADASKLSDGLRLTWSTNTAAADYLASVLMFGGSGIQAHQRELNVITLTPDVETTILTPGFRPDVVFLLSAGIDSGSGSASAGHLSTFGCAIRGGNQVGITSVDANAVTTTDAAQWIANNRVLASITSSGTVSSTIEVTSIVDGGVKITPRLGTWFTDINILALKLPRRVACGPVDLPTVAEDFDVTTVGFRPRIVLQVLSPLSAFNVGAAANAIHSFGLFDGTSEFTSGCVVTDGVATSNTHSISVNKAVHAMKFDGSVLYKGGFASFLDNGYRITYTDVDTTSRKGFYVAFE